MLNRVDSGLLREKMVESTYQKVAVRGSGIPNGSIADRSYTMDTVSKVCIACKESKSLAEFYPRSGKKGSSIPGHYCSECKDCMKTRGKNHKPIDNQVPYALSEQVAIDYLHKMGIPALPGKALSYAWVDVIAFGCVRVEVKYSKLFADGYFKFNLTPQQKKRGLLGDVVMLVCDYGYKSTHHLFLPSFPAFYIKGNLKTGFHFTPGALTARKHGNNRVVMTQPMMDAAQDNLRLVHDQLTVYCENLKRGVIWSAA